MKKKLFTNLFLPNNLNGRMRSNFGWMVVGWSLYLVISKIGGHKCSFNIGLCVKTIAPRFGLNWLSSLIKYSHMKLLNQWRPIFGWMAHGYKLNSELYLVIQMLIKDGQPSSDTVLTSSTPWKVLKIFSRSTTLPIVITLWCNGSLVIPFQNYIWWPRHHQRTLLKHKSYGEM